MESATFLQMADQEARSLLVTAEANWDRPVPHCPDWDAAGLVRHIGEILHWMSAIVTSRERVSRRTMERGPEKPGDLPPWFLAALEQTIEVLGSADPDSTTWTFSSTGDHTVRWWCRRAAVELAIHRWDVDHAAHNDDDPPTQPIDGELASVGIGEFVGEFLPGLLNQEDLEGITGTLHLHGTDGPAEWTIDLDADGAVTPEPSEADTTINGTRSDLLLWLVNRGPLNSLEVSGNRKLLDRWGQLEW